MALSTRHVIWAILAAQALAAPSLQVPLLETVVSDASEIQKSPIKAQRPLHGRFLHMTDFHPDFFYQVYSSTSEESACHRGQGPAGIYGAETSECDSPLLLINKTLDYIAKEFRDKIDFVLWTGDTARHDNDEELPRTPEQVVALNKAVLDKVQEVFGKHNGDEEDDDPNNDYVIPIVPNIGNNDILPHNIFDKGPNTWTRTYANVWRQFIPEAQKHQFEQGGWFYVEVIPHKLAVFSLNTMYFYNKNAAVDGCAAHSEPGYQQMEWLRIQLQFMRDRGMKAIIIGHVPPIRQSAKTTWDETCWQKYALWNKQYRDVIVTSIYGHFNYDHFVLQDFRQLDRDTKHGEMSSYLHTNADENDDDVHSTLSSSYWLQLRDEWSDLPEPPAPLAWWDSFLGSDKSKKHKQKQKKYRKKMGGKYAERFSASFVSASVVPNLFPTLRIFEYNVTGLSKHHTSDDFAIPPPAISSEDNADSFGKKKKKKERKYKFIVPDSPSKSAPPGPAYSPQTLSLLKYTQYFANLTHINNDFSTADNETADADAAKWNEGKHKGKKPHNKDHTPKPRKFQYEVLYDTQDDPIYNLPDLTMPNLADLARRIGRFVPEDEESLLESGNVEADKKNKKMKKKKGKKHHPPTHHRKENEAWFSFVERAFVYTMDPADIQDQFGH